MRRLALACLLATGPVAAIHAQDLDAGRRTFESRCGRCHGADGSGSEYLRLAWSMLPVEDLEAAGAAVADAIHAAAR